MAQEKKYDDAIALLESNRVQAARQHDERSEALILNQLGVTYEKQGRFLAARSALDTAVSRLTRTGEGATRIDNPDLIDPLNNLANLLYESGDTSQAESLVRRSLAILTAARPRGEDVGVELSILAKMYLGEHKLPLAQQSAQESLDTLRQCGHPEDLPASVDWTVLGAVYDNQRNIDRAEDSLRHALSIAQQHFGPQDYRVGEAVANLGLLYANHGLTAKAEPLLEEAHSSFRAHAVNTLFVRSFLTIWADAERKRGHTQKAKDLTQEAKALTAARVEVSMSRDTLDANSFR